MSNPTARPFSPSAERNSEAILVVLRDEFRQCRKILEVGAGTGQHAVHFARALPHVTWQATDREDNLPGIRDWIEAAGLDNLLPPQRLDVHDSQVDTAAYDGGFSANTAHIMSLSGVERMFEVFAEALVKAGRFCLYGPFRQDGEFNSESNASFHRSLQSQESTMGIRHLETLDEFGRTFGFNRARLYSMPANNHIAVWEKAS